MSVLALENVVKVYGWRRALDGISLEIGAGEFTTVLGPSGCGKSTLLKVLAGVEEASSGNVMFKGAPLLEFLATGGRAPVLVWQSLALFPHMSVGDNIGFGLRVRTTSEIEIKRRVDEILEQMNLTGAQSRRIHELSGGEQQRVALARALVVDPCVSFLMSLLAAWTSVCAEYCVRF
jgi:ABC-type Fe3+/spermidine/putrescine transport system ATPase subunit